MRVVGASDLSAGCIEHFVCDRLHFFAVLDREVVDHVVDFTDGGGGELLLERPAVGQSGQLVALCLFIGLVEAAADIADQFQHPAAFLDPQGSSGFIHDDDL